MAVRLYTTACFLSIDSHQRGSVSTFSKQAKSFTGVVKDIDGKSVVIQVDGQTLTFTVEGAVSDELQSGHKVTVVTWGNASAVRVVDHDTNTIYRPYYNSAPDGDEHLAEGNRSPADVPEARMGLTSLLPAVFLATVFQSIPIYGWYVTYKMVANPDKSIPGTAPQYATQAKFRFLVFVLLAFVLSGYMFSSSGDVIKAALVYMTVLYVGTFSLMRTLFRGIEEIDDFTRRQIGQE